MREALVFPITEELDNLTNTLRETMANYAVADGMILKGSLEEVNPEKIYLTPESINTVVNATGKLDLQVEKLSF